MRFDLFWVLMGRTAYVFAPLYLIPFAYGFAYGDPLAGSFLALGVLTAILGMVFGNMGRSHMRQLSVEEGTLFLLFVWLLLAVLGMLPFHLAGLHLSPVDTFFECISALTTTGMTALRDTAPHPHPLAGSHELVRRAALHCDSRIGAARCGRVFRHGFQRAAGTPLQSALESHDASHARNDDTLHLNYRHFRPDLSRGG